MASCRWGSLFRMGRDTIRKMREFGIWVEVTTLVIFDL